LLLGVEALTQLAEAPNPPFKTPVLMLLSGHKIEVPPSLGVVVAQKPLKQSEFVPLLEANAMYLLDVGRCMGGGDTNDNDAYPRSIHSSGSDYGSGGSCSVCGSDSESLVNGHGSQMFFRYRRDPLRLEAGSMTRVPLSSYPAARFFVSLIHRIPFDSLP
jgi:hypothetical protein